MADYTLYSYFRSTCSARLRIALNLKGLHYEMVCINLLKDEQLSKAHLERTPAGTVPVLLCLKSTRGAPLKIGQSVAAMEYLEEAHPGTPSLLPPAGCPERRALVRTLVQIINADLQPVTNLRILRRVRAMGGEAEVWARSLMEAGLAAYEAVAGPAAGEFSVGDDFTMADACLVPAVWNALRYQADLGLFPTISRIVQSAEQHPAVIKAHWRNQPDTPRGLRAQ